MCLQINKGLAYPVNGIIMGGLDWKFSTLKMWIANVICIGSISMFMQPITLSSLWSGLTLFMATQWILGAVRFLSGTGIWNQLRRAKTLGTAKDL